MGKANENKILYNARYTAANYTRTFIRLRKKEDKDIIDYLETVGSKTTYIRNLIIADMKAKGLRKDEDDEYYC